MATNMSCRPDGALCSMAADDMFKGLGDLGLALRKSRDALTSHPPRAGGSRRPGRDPDGLVKLKAFVVLDEHLPGEARAVRRNSRLSSRTSVRSHSAWIEYVDELLKTASGRSSGYLLRDARRAPAFGRRGETGQ